MRGYGGTFPRSVGGSNVLDLEIKELFRFDGSSCHSSYLVDHSSTARISFSNLNRTILSRKTLLKKEQNSREFAKGFLDSKESLSGTEKEVHAPSSIEVCQMTHSYLNSMHFNRVSEQRCIREKLFARTDLSRTGTVI